MMLTTLKLAQEHGVSVGAHPGFADRANFGRVEVPVTSDQVHNLVLSQIEELLAIAAQARVRVRHVKPHGALYNMAARDPVLAAAVAGAVYEADPRFVLVGLAGSRLLEAGSACGLSTLSEVFADRTYRSDGSLTPRRAAGALIEDPVRAVAQVLGMVREGYVNAVDGSRVAIKADTICLHGDGAHAVEFARQLRTGLQEAGIEIKAHGA
jgi:UPF0271 protein